MPTPPPPTSPSGDASECGVCLEDLGTDLAALACGHVFHQSCAARALAHRPQCPICRQKAEHAIRLFYTAAGAAFFSLPSSPETHLSGAEQAAAAITKRLVEMRKSVARLSATQRRMSSYSLRLHTENVRLREENARVALQLEASETKHSAVARELGIWKRISTSTHVQLRDALRETNESSQRVAAATKDVVSELQTLSLCAACDEATKSTKLQLHDLHHYAESKADKQQKPRPARKMACCTTERASRALRRFCERHSSAGPVPTPSPPTPPLPTESATTAPATPPPHA